MIDSRFLAKADRFYRWAVTEEAEFIRERKRRPRHSLADQINKAFNNKDETEIKALMAQFEWKG